MDRACVRVDACWWNYIRVDGFISAVIIRSFDVAAFFLYQTDERKSRPASEILLFVAGRACGFFIKPGHFHGERLKLLIVIVFGHG